MPGPERIEESAATRRPSPELDADHFFAQLELDEERFREVFLERMEQVSGSDPLKSLQRQARDLLQVRGRAGAGRDSREVLRRAGRETGCRIDQEPGSSPLIGLRAKASQCVHA